MLPAFSRRFFILKIFVTRSVYTDRPIMPRTVIRPPQSKGFQGLNLIPLQARIWMKSMLQRLFALVCMLFGVAMILALVSRNTADPSANTALVPVGVNDEVSYSYHNWLGGFGASLADFSWQIMGVASFALALAVAVWGYHWWKTGSKVSTLSRVVVLVLGLVLLAIAAACLPSPAGPPAMWGGFIGALLTTQIQGFAENYMSDLTAQLLIAAITGGIGFVLWAWASLLRWEHATDFIEQVKFRSAWAADHVGRLMPERHEEEEIFAKPKRERKKPVFAADDDDDDLAPFEEEATVTPSATRSQAKVVRPAPKAPEKAAKQEQLLMTDPSDWELPPISLLTPVPASAEAEKLDEGALRKNADMLQNVLNDYNVKGDITSIHPGPVVTLYELEPAPGTKSSRVINLSDDIARSMSAVSVRAAVVPGRNVIGVEIPNKKRQTVYLNDLLTSNAYDKTAARLPLIVGKDIGGEPIIADLTRMPHLLVAGTTGSGKSVAVNTMILSLLYKLTPDQCKFIMIDPKMLELSVYDDIPHLLAPVVTEPGRAIVALKWTVREMENRYRSMSKLGVRNIDGYNARLREARKNGEILMRKVQTGYDIDTGKPVFEDQPIDLNELPYIVVVVDEFADLMLVAGKDVENAIQRLAQMARAAGIHLIMATQRPSVDVITGVIKANFPTRISFQVTSKIDSRTILGEGGAEQLLGMGDMLYMASGGRITRVHGPFVADKDVEHVVKFLRSQGEPSYIDGVTDGDEDFGEEGSVGSYGGGGGGSSVDDMYDQAVQLVAREGKASTSFIQRHLQIGYNRAARIIEEMEKQGVVGAANHVGKREVLVGDHSNY